MASRTSTARGRNSGDGSGKNCSAEALSRIQQENIGRLMLRSFRRYEKAVFEELLAQGFDDLRPTHVSVLTHIPLEGIRTSEIAALASMTKQAVGQIATQLEEMGYLFRHSDPLDGRARILQFTAKGRTLWNASYDILSHSEKRFEDLLGPEHFALLRSCLKTVANSENDTPVPRPR